jgi:hypothetical protein
MYNSELKWYDKKNVLQIFPITERTYFRKLKERSPEIRTKKFKNQKEKEDFYYYWFLDNEHFRGDLGTLELIYPK